MDDKFHQLCDVQITLIIIIAFYFAETLNHLWVVSEILSGGSLADILVQDGRLPLTVVRDFGADICKGLFHLHQNSVIYARLNPTAIALDSSAALKVSVGCRAVRQPCRISVIDIN